MIGVDDMDKATAEMIAEYNSGKSIKNVAKAFGVSAGKMYYLLQSSGCSFRKSGIPVGFKMPAQSVENSARKRRGVKRNSESRAKISEAKKCHYNGLNGYGHTKKHCKGYMLAYAPDHPRAHADGYVMLHTIIMERELGRYLEPCEVVHHINHKRDDNDISNLLLMVKKEHMSMHMKERYQRGGMTYQ